MKIIGYAIAYTLFFTTLASIVFVATIATRNTDKLESNEVRFQYNQDLAEELANDRWTETEHDVWLIDYNNWLRKHNPDLILPSDFNE